MAPTRIAELHRDLAQREYEIQVLKRELGEVASPLGGGFRHMDAETLEHRAADAELSLHEALTRDACEDAARARMRQDLFTMPRNMAHLPTAYGGAADSQQQSLLRQQINNLDSEEQKLKSDILCQGLMRQNILRMGPHGSPSHSWQDARDSRAIRVAEALSTAGGRLAGVGAVPGHMPVPIPPMPAVHDAALQLSVSPIASPTSHSVIMSPPDVQHQLSPLEASLSPVPQLAPPTPTPPHSLHLRPAREQPPQDTVPVGVGSLIQAVRDEHGYHPCMVTGVHDDGSAVDVEWCADGVHQPCVPITHTRVVLTLGADGTVVSDATAHMAAEASPLVMPTSAPAPAPGATEEEDACRREGFSMRMHEIDRMQRGLPLPTTPTARPRRRKQSTTRTTSQGRYRALESNDTWQTTLRADTCVWEKRSPRVLSAGRPKKGTHSHTPGGVGPGEGGAGGAQRRTPTPRKAALHNLSLNLPTGVRAKERSILFAGLGGAGSQFGAANSSAPLLSKEKKFIPPKGWPPGKYVLEESFHKVNSVPA